MSVFAAPATVDEAFRDEEVTRLLNSWRMRYSGKRHGMDPHALEEAIERAIMKAVKGHNPEFKTRFTSSVRCCLSWETNRQLRKILNERKKTELHSDFDPDLVSATHDDIDHRMEVMELTAKVNGWLDRYVPRVTKSIVIGYYIEGKTFDELAELHQCSKDTISKRLDAGVNKLRELALTGQGDGDFTSGKPHNSVMPETTMISSTCGTWKLGDDDA